MKEFIYSENIFFQIVEKSHWSIHDSAVKSFSQFIPPKRKMFSFFIVLNRYKNRDIDSSVRVF